MQNKNKKNQQNNQNIESSDPSMFTGYEEIKPDSPLKKIILAAAALLAITGLLYFSGFYQALFYQKTLPGVQQQELRALVEGQLLLVPVEVIVINEEGMGEQGRNRPDIYRIIENASAIWNQASIKIESTGFQEITLKKEEISVFYTNPGSFIYSLENFNPDLVTAIFVRHLGGIDGIAFGGAKTVAVAEYTTAYDFKVFAHEIGHVLGLSHNKTSNSLMVGDGKLGTSLSIQEVETARKTAERLFVDK